MDDEYLEYEFIVPADEPALIPCEYPTDNYYAIPSDTSFSTPMTLTADDTEWPS